MSIVEETPETPGEDPEGASRAAGGCVLVVALGAAGGVVYAVPELGYTVAGALATVAVGKARGWAAGRRQDADEEAPEQDEPVDIVAVLQHLGHGGEHVRLTQLQEAAGLPDTKAVRALLDEAGIRIRSGVRSGGKNGPGVHATDIPPIEATPSEGCLCRSGANTNTNNDAGKGPEKGFRVEHTGQAGVTVYDLSETHRHHATT
ncbi:hypothetical protein ACFY8P_04445 [Streptomyces sp. NPDC012693]|uniref:hypothetical protein n=1 Tax=Streptomyces sp. NPDC012693 TaxID=3364844 RepID=UPI0036C531DE